MEWIEWFGHWMNPESDPKLGRLAYELTPGHEQLVFKLVHDTLNLELANESVKFAPLKGIYGPFTLSGNGLPKFHYRVFDQSLMEFVLVFVELSKPARIEFFAQIEAKELELVKKVEVKEKYKEPFFALAHQLYRYFPYYPDTKKHLSFCQVPHLPEPERIA